MFSNLFRSNKATNSAQRRWLPSLRDLAPEQRDIINRPISDRMLIYGPAGSGKTVISIYLAHMLKQQNKRFLLFVYTNELHNFLHAAAHDLQLPAESVMSFYGWVWRQYRDHIGPPPDKQYDRWVTELLHFFRSNPRRCPHYDTVLVDEAQDFSPEVSQLIQLLSAKLVVVGDGAQSLYQNIDDMKRLAEMWGVQQQHQLSKNYRNPRSIANVAAQFLTDPGVSPEQFLAMVPGRQSEMRPVWRSVLTPDEQSDYIAEIVRSARGQERIGILFPNNRSLQAEAARLHQRGLTVHVADKQKVSGDNIYNSATPILITAHSAKGLEFDWIILPDLNQFTWDSRGCGPEQRRLFFVALTRTKNRAYLIAQHGQESAFLREIPTTLLQHVPSPHANGVKAPSTTVSDDDDIPF